MFVQIPEVHVCAYKPTNYSNQLSKFYLLNSLEKYHLPTFGSNFDYSQIMTEKPCLKADEPLYLGVFPDSKNPTVFPGRSSRTNARCNRAGVPVKHDSPNFWTQNAGRFRSKGEADRAYPQRKLQQPATFLREECRP
jgi:hypothetical protein